VIQPSGVIVLAATRLGCSGIALHQILEAALQQVFLAQQHVAKPVVDEMNHLTISQHLVDLNAGFSESS